MRLLPLVAVLFSSVLVTQLATAGPTITRITPCGLQAGASTTLIIDGDGLLPDPQLLLAGVPLGKQTLKPGANAKRVELEVSVESSAALGIALLRLAGPGGVSNAQPVVISNIPELPFGPRIAALPVALSGNLAGSAVMSAAFAGKKGERVVADVAARRLGASVQPAVHIYDGRGTQLAWSPALPALSGDARCEIVLPADGEYRVEVHDALYRGAEPSQFRVSVGNLDYADFAFPLAVERGRHASLEFLATNLPAAAATTEIAAPAVAGTDPAPWPSGNIHPTGGHPAVLVSDYPELAEDPSTAGPTQLSGAPIGASGRLLKPGRSGMFRLPVKVGQKLHIEVLANRIGSPVDPVLVVSKEKGGQLATNDDRPGTKDPAVDVTVPNGVDALLIEVRDLYGAGGPNYIYHVEATPQAQPDFTLLLADDRLQVPQGGAALLRVSAKRDGYTGPIRLTFAGLPEGIKADLAEIPAGTDAALVSFSAPPSDAARATIFSIRGDSVDSQPAVARLARLETSPAYKYQPWIGTQLAAAIVPLPPVTLAWEPPSSNANLVAGVSLPASVQVTRSGDAKGKVRVTLLTTQTTPRKTVKTPGKPDQQVDAVERTIRLAADLEIAADQSSAKGEILVPADLPLLAYDLALQADLLAADGKTVVASTVTPARRFTAVPPFQLELTGAAEVEGRAGLGAAGKWAGKLARAAGFQAPVKVTLTGLPKDVFPPSVTLAGDTADFELPATFRFGTPAGDAKGVKLIAVSIPDDKNPEVEYRSPEIPVQLKIAAGEKPPAEQPLLVFEDQADFREKLNQGGGQATLVDNDKYSGQAAIKVTPDQRFSAKLPGLNVKVRQNPGPGEYRFIQFAWKKQGGQAVCLMLAHDGKFGPEPRKPPKFRYHAGTGPEPFGASQSVDGKIPAGFTVVTRDLYADFGEFTLTGLGLGAVDGEFAVFDHIYLGRDPGDFDLVKP